MEIQAEKKNGVWVLMAEGRIGVAAAGDFDAQILPHAETPGARLILDLGRVEYAASMALRTILETAKRLQASGGWFAVAGATGQVAELLELAGLDNLVPVYPSLEQALAAAPGGGS